MQLPGLCRQIGVVSSWSDSLNFGIQLVEYFRIKSFFYFNRACCSTKDIYNSLDTRTQF